MKLFLLLVAFISLAKASGQLSSNRIPSRYSNKKQSLSFIQVQALLSSQLGRPVVIPDDSLPHLIPIGGHLVQKYTQVFLAVVGGFPQKIYGDYHYNLDVCWDDFRTFTLDLTDKDNYYCPLSTMTYDKTINMFNTALFDLEDGIDSMVLTQLTFLKANAAQISANEKVYLDITALYMVLTKYGESSPQYSFALQEFLVILDELKKMWLDRHPQGLFDVGFFDMSTCSSDDHDLVLEKRSIYDIPVSRNTSLFCMKSESTCEGNTNKCNGRGNCVDPYGTTCFKCQCRPGYTGHACQYEDYVGSFNIIFWTSFTLALTVLSTILVLLRSPSELKF